MNLSSFILLLVLAALSFGLWKFFRKLLEPEYVPDRSDTYLRVPRSGWPFTNSPTFSFGSPSSRAYSAAEQKLGFPDGFGPTRLSSHDVDDLIDRILKCDKLPEATPIADRLYDAVDSYSLILNRIRAASLANLTKKQRHLLSGLLYYVFQPLNKRSILGKTQSQIENDFAFFAQLAQEAEELRASIASGLGRHFA